VDVPGGLRQPGEGKKNLAKKGAKRIPELCTKEGKGATARASLREKEKGRQNQSKGKTIGRCQKGGADRPVRQESEGGGKLKVNEAQNRGEGNRERNL